MKLLKQGWEYTKKFWDFVWNGKSIWSWLVFVVLAFVFVKFLLLPGIGLISGTDLPVVVVLSGSMEHDFGYDEWWDNFEGVYSGYNISQENFTDFRFSNGFNKGDLMFVYGKEEYSVGDVIIFEGAASAPLIHRIVKIEDGLYNTRGDHNTGVREDEKNINIDRIHGKAFLRIPYVGWIKIGALKLFGVDY